MAVERAVGGGENSVELHERAELVRLVEIHEAARDAELVLQRDARLEGGDVVRSVEEEEVADLVQVDLRARALFELGEGLDAAKAEGDVERIRELRAESSRGTARRPARELVSLE